MSERDYQRLLSRQAQDDDRVVCRDIRLEVAPLPKPRMTRGDSWMNPPRRCVAAYRAYCDTIRRLCGPEYQFPSEGAHITFHLPMPASWSGKHRQEMDGQPHMQTPDVDNLAKAILDALNIEDSHIWDLRITKRWAVVGAVHIQLST